jgi:RNA recognition motif-containing protein
LFFPPNLAVDRVVNSTLELDGRLLDVKRALARGVPSRPIDKLQNKLFIGGLPFETTEEDIKEYFSRFGDIVYVQIIVDRETGRPRGFGFVSFENDESVYSVLEERTHVICGKVVEVNHAEPKVDHTEKRCTSYPLPGSSSNGDLVGMYPAQVRYMQTMQMMQMRQVAIMNMLNTQSYGGGTNASYGGWSTYPGAVYSRNIYDYRNSFQTDEGSLKRGTHDDDGVDGNESDCDSSSHYSSYSKRRKFSV